MPEISNIGLLTAFLAGVISFLSPCVLPLVPGYVSYISGRSVTDRTTAGTVAIRLPAVGLSVFFVLGFSTIFILLGASATALGQLLLAYRFELNIIGGSIVIVFGLFMLGLIRSSWLQREFRLNTSIPGGRPTSAYVLGLAFGFGWTPCIGPILGAILTLFRKIRELATLKRAVLDLSERCLGDDRPECPILDELSGTASGEYREHREVGFE